MTIHIRPETSQDVSVIASLTRAAFAGVPHSDGCEADIIDRLRAANDLTFSLVAEQEGKIVGHVAFSPVTIAGIHDQWFGLGPLSVAVAAQGRGVGSALVNDGLRRLQRRGARGCVLVGDPAYYRRFGFVGDGRIAYEGVPAPYMQWRILRGQPPAGAVRYCPAFG